MTNGPPRDVAPDVLFRLLLGRPRPRRRIAWRARCAPDVPLYARGLTGLEVASVLDAHGGLEPEELRHGRALCELAARALVLQDWQPAFPDGLTLANLLDARETAALSDDVSRALTIVSPFYATADAGAWHRALVKGARSARNLHTAVSLGRCVDVAYGPAHREVLPRPERFFGGAQGDLTDGQWFAFRAARAVVVDMEKQ